MESKEGRDVSQADQPDLFLPSESELQMAQVGDVFDSIHTIHVAGTNHSLSTGLAASCCNRSRLHVAAINRFSVFENTKEILLLLVMSIFSNF